MNLQTNGKQAVLEQIKKREQRAIECLSKNKSLSYWNRLVVILKLKWEFALERGKLNDNLYLNLDNYKHKSHLK